MDTDPEQSAVDDLTLLTPESYNQLLNAASFGETWISSPEVGSSEPALHVGGTTLDVAQFLVSDCWLPISAPENSYTHVRLPVAGSPDASVVNRGRAASAPLIPATESFEGSHSFSVSCALQEKKTKSASWAYVKERRKLFINMNVVCPFHVHVKTEPPAGTALRAMAVFSEPSHANEVVKRCPMHILAAEGNGGEQRHPPPSHLIRCENPCARYLDDPITKRHSVVVAYNGPQAGLTYSVYHYRFMCLSSCSGGMNRRPIKVIFTLEHEQQVLGRSSMDVKICACPGRDRDTEDRQHGIRAGAHGTAQNGHTKRGAPVEANFARFVPAKRMRADDEEDPSLVVKCRTVGNYQMLSMFNDYLNQVQAETSYTEQNTETQQLALPGLLRQLHGASERAKGTVDTSPGLSASFEESVQVKNENEDGSSNRTIASWLESLNLATCSQALLEHGYKDTDSMQKMTVKELKKLGFSREQERKIWLAILALGGEDEELPLSQRSGGLPVSQESLAPGSQDSNASSTSSARAFRVTHVRLTTCLREERFT